MCCVLGALHLHVMYVIVDDYEDSLNDQRPHRLCTAAAAATAASIQLYRWLVATQRIKSMCKTCDERYFVEVNTLFFSRHFLDVHQNSTRKFFFSLSPGSYYYIWW